MIFILMLLSSGKLSVIYDAIHDFSVWLRTGSNPADIILFEAILEKAPMIIFERWAKASQSKIKLHQIEFNT